MNIKTHKALFSITTAFFWFSLYTYVAELSTFAKDLGASYKMVGMITGSYGLTQLVLRIPLGIFSDRIGKRKVFVSMGLLVSVVSCLITFFNPSTYSLLVTRLLAGVSASTWVLFTVFFSSYYKKEEATKAIGIMGSFNSVGQLSAMLIGGFVSLTFGTKYLYLLGAVGGIVGFVLSLSIYENKNVEKQGARFIDFIQVARDKQLLFVSVLAILSQFITFATAFGFVPILAKNMGAKNVELSLLTAISIFPGIFMSTISGSILAKKWGALRTIGIGFFISSVLCVLMPMIPNLGLLYGAQFLSGIGRSMTFTLLMGLGIAHIDNSKRATAMGFFQAIYGIGMVVGPIMLGYIAQQYSLLAGFVVTGVIGFGAIGVIILKSIVSRHEIHG